MSSTARPAGNPLHRLIDWLIRLEAALGPVHSAATAEDRERAMQRWDAELDAFWSTVPKKYISEAIDMLADGAIAWCARNDLKDAGTRNKIEEGSRLVVEMAQSTRPFTCEWNNRDPETPENRERQKEWSAQGKLLELARETARVLRRIAATGGEEWLPESVSTPGPASGPGILSAEVPSISIDDLLARIEQGRPNPIVLSDSELVTLSVWMKHHSLSGQTKLNASRGDSRAFQERDCRKHLAFVRCCAEKRAKPISIDELFARIRAARPNLTTLSDNERIVLSCWLTGFRDSFATQARAQSGKDAAAADECDWRRHLRMVLELAERLHAGSVETSDPSPFKEQLKAEAATRREKLKTEADRLAIHGALAPHRDRLNGDQRTVADWVAGYMGIGAVLREHSLEAVLDELMPREQDGEMWFAPWTEHVRLLRLATSRRDGAEEAIRLDLTSHLEARKTESAGRFFQLLHGGFVSNKLVDAVDAVFGGRPCAAPAKESKTIPAMKESGTAAVAAPTDALPVKSKRKKQREDEREKTVALVANLTKHHDYSDGSCLNLEPIGNNELARAAGVSKSTASRFFEEKFKGHSTYKTRCRDAGKLADSLKLLNGEFSPHDLYGRNPPREDDRKESDE